MSALHSAPLLGGTVTTPNPGPRAKRAVDVVAASIALVMFAPLIAAIALAVLVALGRPVLFRQERAGLGGRTFSILKFRTMLDPALEKGLVTDEQRLTRFGKFLRSTSLDELPGLVNVLRGEMSIVGPRPLPIAYLQHYSPTEARRHAVRPGITGLAQVRGRNLASWDDRLRWDVEYVDTVGFHTDLHVVARTVAVVIRRSGISAVGQATCESLIMHRTAAAQSRLVHHAGDPLTNANT
ncbi:sugar transferase [Curtobacterium sp. VKM Ac-2884]|nr:sugar transferase [Curtobacterium sp. VKM Ac-2884]